MVWKRHLIATCGLAPSDRGSPCVNLCVKSEGLPWICCGNHFQICNGFLNRKIRCMKIALGCGMFPQWNWARRPRPILHQNPISFCVRLICMGIMWCGSQRKKCHFFDVESLQIPWQNPHPKFAQKVLDSDSAHEITRHLYTPLGYVHTTVGFAENCQLDCTRKIRAKTAWLR